MNRKKRDHSRQGRFLLDATSMRILPRALRPFLRRGMIASLSFVFGACSEPASSPAAVTTPSDSMALLADNMAFNEFARVPLRSFRVGTQEFYLLFGYREKFLAGQAPTLALVPKEYYEEIVRYFNTRAQDCPAAPYLARSDIPSLHPLKQVQSFKQNYLLYIPNQVDQKSAGCRPYEAATDLLERELRRYDDVGDAYATWKNDAPALSEGYLNPAGDPYTALAYDVLVYAKTSGTYFALTTSGSPACRDGGASSQSSEKTATQKTLIKCAIASGSAGSLGAITIASVGGSSRCHVDLLFGRSGRTCHVPWIGTSFSPGRCEAGNAGVVRPVYS